MKNIGNLTTEEKELLKNFEDYTNNFRNLKKEHTPDTSRKQEIQLYNFVTLKIRPLIESYLKTNKKIDKKFIFNIVQILEN